MFLRDDTSLVCLFYWRGVRLFSSLQPCNFGKSSSEKTARKSVERFLALASAKYMAGQEEHGGDLVQKVKLALFIKTMVSSPSVCTKAGGVFVSQAHLVKFYCRS